MTKAEVFEEVRAKLREPYSAFSEQPPVYQDSDLTIQLRSALRWAKAKGVETVVTLDLSDSEVFSEDPSDDLGYLLACKCAASLLKGDMTQKVLAGELGLAFRAGTDSIDTKSVATLFRASANSFEQEAEIQLTMVLSDTSAVTGNVFGSPTLS